MRTPWTLVGMGLLVLGGSPLVWAQDAGSITVTACLPCHAGGAAGPQAAPTFPKLDGQHAAYLEKQLREYMAGKRKSDIMAPIFGALKKQQIPGMAAHFASQAPARGVVENPELAARGKLLYEEGNRATGVPGCIGCHLPDGAGSHAIPAWRASVKHTPCSNSWTSRVARAATTGLASCASSRGVSPKRR